MGIENCGFLVLGATEEVSCEPVEKISRGRHLNNEISLWNGGKYNMTAKLEMGKSRGSTKGSDKRLMFGMVIFEKMRSFCKMDRNYSVHQSSVNMANGSRKWDKSVCFVQSESERYG